MATLVELFTAHTSSRPERASIPVLLNVPLGAIVECRSQPQNPWVEVKFLGLTTYNGEVYVIHTFASEGTDSESLGRGDEYRVTFRSGIRALYLAPYEPWEWRV